MSYQFMFYIINAAFILIPVVLAIIRGGKTMKIFTITYRDVIMGSYKFTVDIQASSQAKAEKEFRRIAPGCAILKITRR